MWNSKNKVKRNLTSFLPLIEPSVVKAKPPPRPSHPPHCEEPAVSLQPKLYKKVAYSYPEHERDVRRRLQRQGDHDAAKRLLRALEKF